jgi:hypothetical protein
MYLMKARTASRFFAGGGVEEEPAVPGIGVPEDRQLDSGK